MNSRIPSWSIVVFAGALLAAGPAVAQPTGTAPSGTPPVGPPPVGPGPVGPGPIGPFPSDLRTLSGLTITEPMLPLAEMRLLSATLSQQDRERDAEMRDRDRENRIYDEAYRFMDQRNWDRAVQRFNDVIALKGARADAAMYHKAWSQNRAGQRSESLTTIAALVKEYPASRYLKPSRALEAEVRRDSGQPIKPENENDEDLKVLALQYIANSSPEQAIPALEKILDGAGSPRLKERALYVLAQSNSAQAREILKNIAKGSSTPELQSRAINYLGTQGGRESRAALQEIYTSTSDVDIKRRILRAFMAAGEKDRVFAAAQSETNADVRGEAIRQLGAMGAHEELWQLYQKESALELKKQMLSAMFSGGNVTRMIDLAKTEQNPELRRTAVRYLGQMGTKRTGDALLEIYNSEKDPAVKRSVIQGLAMQDNAAVLVALARKEPDMTLKKEIVQRLSTMKSPEATAYMLEILNAR